jgi:cell division protein FtsQ
MTARIARGSTAAARRPAKSARGGSRKRGKAKRPGLFEGLPISAATARKLGLWSFFGAVTIVAAASAIAFRVPQRIGGTLGEQVGAAGFAVSRVELRGLNRLDASTVTKAALDQPSLAMPLIDLDAIRARLMEFKWVKEARVHRRLPDTLVVEIEERVPAAVWQHNRRLQLVDMEGVELEAVRPDAMPNLPLVVGPGAQHRIAELGNLVGAVPQVKEVLAGATWIGGRRWDVRFKTGETLSLPEGGEQAGAALKRFMDMNARRHLLGGNFLRFDMRIEGKMIVQLRNAPPAPGPDGAPAASPSAPAQPAQPPKDLSRTI